MYLLGRIKKRAFVVTAINTIIMAVKKRICYKERLKTHDPATIKSIIEGRMNVEKYLERKRGQDRSRWEVIT